MVLSRLSRGRRLFRVLGRLLMMVFVLMIVRRRVGFRFILSCMMALRFSMFKICGRLDCWFVVMSLRLWDVRVRLGGCLLLS